MELSPKENLLRAIEHQHPQWVPNGMESVIMLMRRWWSAQAGGIRFLGVLYEFSEETRAAATRLWAATPSPTWRSAPPDHHPDIQPGLGRRAPGLAGRERVRADEIDRRENLVCGIVEFGLFERSYMLLGMENALVAYLTMPDLMDELLAAIADYKIALISRFHEVVPLDIVWYGDDWGTQLSPFMARSCGAS